MTDTTPAAVERLCQIEESGGGCADLQFTEYAPTLRALSAQLEDAVATADDMEKEAHSAIALWGAALKELEAERDKAWKTCLAATTRGMELEATNTANEKLQLAARQAVKIARVEGRAEGLREAVDHAIACVDAQSEYDRELCCGGLGCGCRGETVHGHICSHILALIPADTPVKVTVQEAAKVLLAAYPKESGWSHKTCLTTNMVQKALRAIAGGRDE